MSCNSNPESIIDTQIRLSNLPIPSVSTPLYLHHASGRGVCWGLPTGESGWAGGNHETWLPDLHPLYRPHVLGSTGNAGLVHQLWWRQIKDIKIGSPLAAADVVAPSIVLQRMRQFQRLPSQGGYRTLTGADLVSYQLILAENMPDVQVELLKTHPAWPGLSFVADLDRLATARLLALIVDPRWYIEPAQPDHQRKIFSYLGLVPAKKGGYANMEAILGHTKSGGANYQRAQLVVQAWNANRAWAPLPSIPPDRCPGAYFQRYYTQGGATPRALLHTSRRFVRYLCLVWQEELRRLQRAKGDGTQLEPAFVARHFFGEAGADEDATIVAYDKHRAAFS